jgi:hypothetical protein
MAVKIIIDDYGIDRTEDARDLTEHDVKSLHSVREEIRTRLAYVHGAPLVLRMPGDVFKRRFADMDGQPGLSVQRISPRQLLRGRLGGLSPPAWLTAELADALGMMQPGLVQPSSAGDVLDRLLSLIAPDLITAPSLNAFAISLGRQTAAFSELLRVPEVAARLRERLAGLGLTTEPGAMLSMFAKDTREGYRALAACILRERLDQFILNNDLGTELALPPRICPVALSQAFGSLPLDAAGSEPYRSALLQLLDIAEREIRGGAMSPAALADLVLQDWPQFLERLQCMFESNAGIASEPLILALEELDSADARELATRMREYLANNHCQPLPVDVAVKQALVWSNAYLRYALGAFERHEEPADVVSESFAKWVGAREIEIQQSDYDWRAVSRAVEADLELGRLVILCMVDALSALHQDLLNLALNEHIDPELVGAPAVLFAPLPTITEVGKIAVMTGKSAGEQSGDYDRALRDRYADFLDREDQFQFVKNWNNVREPLHQSTRLLVYLENRIDDDLHRCTDFTQHRDRVRTVCQQLAKQIKRWLQDARRRGTEVAVFITADHGATKVSRLAQTLPGTSPLERRVLQPCGAFDLPVGDDYLRPRAFRNASTYLIPYARVAFDDCRTMLHGGLTPEEVLIPFVRIGPANQEAQGALRLVPVDGRGDAVRNGWYVKFQLENSHSEAFVNMQIRVLEPFTGQHRVQSIGPLEDSAPFIMELKSEMDQSGRLLIPFELRYQTRSDGPSKRERVELAIELAPHIVEQDQAAREFDDAFD